MNNTIKVGFLASYDYKLLQTSIPIVYNAADEITLAIDKNRLTWSGNTFAVENDFFEWLKQFDTNHKIRIYEDDFYVSDLSPMENETRERSLLAKYMGLDGWHIQLDTDEYFIDFDGFTNFLKNKADKFVKPNEAYGVYAKVITLFKKTKNGFIYITSPENFPIATRNPQYEVARMVKGGKLLSNFFMIHQSWAREKNEMLAKINNWGHANDFNTQSYYNFWDACDEHNYPFYNNFHPLSKTMWESLAYTEGKSIPEFISNYRTLHDQELIRDKHFYQPLPKKKGKLSRMVSSLKSIIKKLKLK
ncbi:hypothetical protein [Solitalea koreensis]|uniref:Glycosyl transferase family 2 n=1 Tax=Solitalea koreensis TaxID=543615 RepID=A0A521CIN0_9SPHI|nr:hypothetical protein [Solitalea koreensis]SMO58601.1 hypothetical protein SAMN06265350_10449 [Solitalea koreensis]